MQPDTLERNQATNKAIAIGKRYESEIKSRYRAGSKMKMVHSRGAQSDSGDFGHAADEIQICPQGSGAPVYDLRAG